MQVLKHISLAALFATAVSVWSGPTGSWERDPDCVVAGVEDTVKRLDALLAARRAGDVEAITAHYSPDAILMAPGDASIRLGRREIAQYYSTPTGRFTSEVLTQSHEANCSSVSIAGTERRRWSSDPSKPSSTATIDFRLMLEYGDGRWLIVHDHAQVLDAASPEAPASVATPLEPARVTTGSIPAPAPSDRAPFDRAPAGSTPSANNVQSDITVPSPTFALSTAPPVFFPIGRPALRATPRERDVTIPALPPELYNNALPRALQPPAEPPTARTAAHASAAVATAPQREHFPTPRLPGSSNKLRPDNTVERPSDFEGSATALLLDLPALPVAAPFPFAPPKNDALPPLDHRRHAPEHAIALTSIAPALPFHVGPAPDLMPGPRRQGTSEQAKLQPPSPPTKAPAVASFSKRIEPKAPPVAATTAAKPMAAAKPSPRQETAAAVVVAAKPVAAKPKSSYRPGRWVYDHPVFD